MKTAFSALTALVRNDLRLFFSDRRALMITVLVPVGIASFFGMILGGGGSGGTQGTTELLIVDADRSSVSQKIIANLQKEPLLTVRTVPEAEARSAVAKGKAPVALLLPKAFGTESVRAVFGGSSAARPTVPLLHDPSHGAEYQIVRGLVTQQVMQVVTQQAFSGQLAPDNLDAQIQAVQSSTTTPPTDKTALTDLLQSVKRYNSRPQPTGTAPNNSGGGPGLQMPVNLSEETVAGANAARVGTITHIFAGMAVQGILFFAIDAAMSILRDRRNGVWKRLRAAPLSRGVLLGGKIGSSALIGLVILGIVWSAGAVLFRIRVGGSFLGFVLVGASTALMVAAFGLLIAALGKTEQQSRGYAVPAVLGMSILGGAWFPAFLMPRWVQAVSLAIPSRWAVDGFDAMTWRGFGLSSALLPSLMLLGFAVLFGAFAFARFRWEAAG